jgi:sodium-dependent dicarboxylate transporter 2/3/5
MSDESRASSRLARIGLPAGPLAACLLYWLLPASIGDVALTDGGRATAAVAALMAAWWLTEALPLPATALLPIVLFPPLGVTPIKDATAPYASDVVFLFMGGFMLGLAMQRWRLHTRLALRIVLLVGTQPRRLIGGFMLATALISMWISNTATAVMMFPVAVSVVEMLRRELGDNPDDQQQLRHFAVALMLGVAYSASIGGMGSLIGTPPNVVLASFTAQELGIEISMLDWFAFGVPLMAVLLPLTWWYLVHVAHPARLPASLDSAAFLREEFAGLGAMTRAERRVLAVFALAALAWILRPQIAAALALPQLSDSGIAVTAAVALFLLPAGRWRGERLMDWETAATLPWGILLLFGGGLSLAAAIGSTGIDQYIAASFSGLADAPQWLLIGAVVLTITLLSELSSNTAVATTFIPVLAAVAAGLGLAPLPVLLAATLAASCSFMLPVATPPNAIVFGSGYLRIADMVRAGFWTDVASVVLITALVMFVA